MESEPASKRQRVAQMSIGEIEAASSSSAPSSSSGAGSTPLSSRSAVSDGLPETPVAEEVISISQPLPGGSDEEFEAWVARALRAAPGSSPGESTSDELPEKFKGYSFTGTLRPGRVSPKMAPPEGCSSIPDYGTHPKGVARSEFMRSRTKTIPILQGEDLATMREACRLGREVLDLAARFLKPGVTGDEIDRVVYFACQERRLYPSPLNYFGFPKSVCVSANEVICHGIPDSRVIQDGDIVNLDISICHNGFHSDLNETFFVGQCDQESAHLVTTAYNSLKAATAIIRPGTMYRQLGALIEAEASKAGCSVVTAFCGHGIGRLFHGPPDVPHFKKNKAVGVMKPGHVFTVEPMVNLGKAKERLWPDEWTAVTKDGRRSAQFEHTFLVTEDGFEILTSRPGQGVRSMPAFNEAAFQR